MLSGITTLVLLALFVGGSIWVWRPERRPEFDEAARLPLHDDDDDTDAGAAP